MTFLLCVANVMIDFAKSVQKKSLCVVVIISLKGLYNELQVRCRKSTETAEYKTSRRLPKRENERQGVFYIRGHFDNCDCHYFDYRIFKDYIKEPRLLQRGM